MSSLCLFCCNISVLCFLEHVRGVIGSDFIHEVCGSILLAKLTAAVCNMYINADGGKIFVNLLLSLLRQEAVLWHDYGVCYVYVPHFNFLTS